MHELKQWFVLSQNSIIELCVHQIFLLWQNEKCSKYNWPKKEQLFCLTVKEISVAYKVNNEHGSG